MNIIYVRNGVCSWEKKIDDYISVRKPICEVIVIGPSVEFQGISCHSPIKLLEQVEE